MQQEAEANHSPQKLGASATIALLLLTLVIRGCVLWAMSDHLKEDPDIYRAIAENTINRGVYGFVADSHGSVRPTAYRPPLYPLLLTRIAYRSHISAVSVGLLHLVLGVATAYLVLLLGIRWGLGRWSLLAALLTACDPILLNQSTFVMTETLAAFLAVSSLYSLTRFSDKPAPWTAAAAGGLLGLAILCRPPFLIFLAMAVLALLLKKKTRKTHLLNAALLGLAAAIVLSPWTVRNYRTFGHPIFATSHGGYTLLLGNNPRFYQHLRETSWGTVWDAKELQPIETLAADRQTNSGNYQRDQESINDRLAYQRAWRNIRQEPAMFLYASLVRVGRLWSIAPHKTEPNESRLRQIARCLIGVWYLLIFGFSLYGGWCLRGRLLHSPWLWGVLLCLSFTLLHAIYWSNMRMRAPLIPVVCLLAAAGASKLAASRSRRK